MQFLTFTQLEFVAEYAEVIFKIRNWMFFGMFVVDSQSSSDIYDFCMDSCCIKFVQKFVDTSAECFKVIHLQNLTAYVEVQSLEVYLRKFLT